MTAVIPSPSAQSGARLGWYTTADAGQGALSSMSADEVSRMFMPRKSVQRSNSSSSLSSYSSTSTVSATQPATNAGQKANLDLDNWSSKKKPSRNLWPNSKAEPVSGVTNARSQAVPALTSVGSATSTMSALHQPPSIVPSEHMLQPSQQNGIRTGNGQPGDLPAILTLVPINGTFDKKQINVPFFPDVLRVGRQTNAKTIPTPSNGFFDSKVLSRQHADIWADRTGKIWIRDVKSSNGTFINGKRLSPESRESEPHELRENDTLELGIDIVSEDQKTIVHHKVSAKVEHAGIYQAIPNILDLNFGDLDPCSGSGLRPPFNQPLGNFRGRAGSTMSNRSSSSVASSQLNAMHQQRQLNYWSSPVSIEQVVRRLTHEMELARQQAEDLRQTDEFLATMIKSNNPPADKEKSKFNSESNGAPLMNGRPKMSRVDSTSKFSDPPAPPPQQPLPEKPDVVSPLKRSDSEKQKPGVSISPVSRESSQILSLIEALASAKRDLESQGARVKELENLLRQERSAREWAEEKARKLENQFASNDSHEAKASPELSQGAEQPTELIQPPITAELNESDDIAASETIDQPQVSNSVKSSVDARKNIETVMQEMEVMRCQVEEFRKRAEKAEGETNEARKSLAEMIETLRRERAKGLESSKLSASCVQNSDEHANAGTHLESQLEIPANQSLTESQTGELGTTTAITLQRHKYNLLEQSSPYASMLGVVLLGVGLMAYLNGWQKLDK